MAPSKKNYSQAPKAAKPKAASEKVSKADLSKLKSELRAEFNSKLDQLARGSNITFVD